MKNKPLPHSHWRHYKSTGWVDHTYEVIGIVKHSETEEAMVIYRPLYPVLPGNWAYWYEFVARPLSMWYDIVEHDGKQLQRFIEIE